MQQMAQSNAINQQTIQGLQNNLQQNANAPQQERKKEKLPQLSEFDGNRLSTTDGNSKQETRSRLMKSLSEQRWTICDTSLQDSAATRGACALPS
jgi:hypothetical protein